MTARRYRVDLAPAAVRQLLRLPPGDAARLRGPILSLGVGPRLPGVAKLADTDLWRLRVGDLRLIFAIDDRARVVVILSAARRNESTYRQR